MNKILLAILCMFMTLTAVAEEFNWLNMSGNLLIGGGIFVSLSKENCEAGFASHEGRCLSTDSTNSDDPVYTKKTKGDIGKGVALIVAGMGIKYLSTQKENSFNGLVNTNPYLQNLKFKVDNSGYTLQKVFNF